jgi:hypothetical protein
MLNIGFHNGMPPKVGELSFRMNGSFPPLSD